MFGANTNESVDEKTLASCPKAHYYPFVDQKLPFDFYDPDKGCVIVGYICSLPSYVLKELEEEDIVAFLDNAGYFYMNCFLDDGAKESDVLSAGPKKFKKC